MAKDDNGIEAVGERLYAALDGQNWSELVSELLAPDLVVQVGSEPPVGPTEWRRNQEMFYRASPDGRHIIEDTLVAHHGQLEMHGLQQPNPPTGAPSH